MGGITRDVHSFSNYHHKHLDMRGIPIRQGKDGYSYSTFHTQRQLNVLYINTIKRNVLMKHKDKVLECYTIKDNI